MNARDHTENGFRQIRKICDYIVVSKVTKILLVKDHARKGKESFHVKTKDSTCATFAVCQFKEEEEEEDDEQKYPKRGVWQIQ